MRETRTVGQDGSRSEEVGGDWESRFVQLEAQVRGCGGATVIELAEVLLRWCREEMAELRMLLEEPDSLQAALAMEEATRQVSDAFDRGQRHEGLEEDDATWFVEVLERTARATRSTVAAARAVAEGLEEGMGHRFARCFQGTNVEARPAMAFPVEPERVTSRFSRHGLTTSRRRRSGKQWDALPHLRLAPQDLRGFRILLDWQHEHSLEFLRHAFRVGVALPNAMPTQELCWESYERQGGRFFFHVRPKDEVAQQATLLELLHRAEQEQVELLLLPELCLTPDLLAAVRNWFHSNARHLKLLVAGSYHIQEGGLRRNTCVALLQGAHEISHHKFNPFVLWEEPGGQAKTQGAQKVPRTEDIHVAPHTLTLYLTGAVSMTLLICKDFLHDDVLDLLQGFEVDLVLVPALSPQGGVFEQAAGEQLFRRQAVVLVANAADGGGPYDQEPVALLARPLRHSPRVIARRQDAPLPALLWTDLQGPDTCWIFASPLATKGSGDPGP